MIADIVAKVRKQRRLNQCDGSMFVMQGEMFDPAGRGEVKGCHTCFLVVRWILDSLSRLVIHSQYQTDTDGEPTVPVTIPL